MQNNTLEEFLNNKTLYYDKIDYNCIELSWNEIKKHIKSPYVIHIVGTNGKGSTGRFLASFLNQLNYSVLHYSSPHIIEFNERIWIDGKNSSDLELETAHQEIQSILNNKLLEQLTYFEYTTLLALYISNDMDYLILEAGLGGEFDATNVIENQLTILTTIGLDHQSFLGNTIEEITLTKARSCDKAIVIGYQKDKSVKNIVKNLFGNSRVIIDAFQTLQDTSSYKIANYLRKNLYTVFCVLEYLGLEKKEFDLPKLFGRFEYFKENIIIDVGHNPLAASMIAEELGRVEKKVNLIYNSYSDKDYEENLKLLKPYITTVQIIEIDDARIVDRSVLISVIKKLGLDYEIFDISNISVDKNYLVFGSFVVVEKFLKDYKS